MFISKGFIFLQKRGFMRRNTTPTTEEFLDYLTVHPDAKNKDIAEHFHIAPTTAATLKSQIKNGTRPEKKGYKNLAVKGSSKANKKFTNKLKSLLVKVER